VFTSPTLVSSWKWGVADEVKEAKWPRSLVYVDGFSSQECGLPLRERPRLAGVRAPSTWTASARRSAGSLYVNGLSSQERGLPLRERLRLAGARVPCA